MGLHTDDSKSQHYTSILSMFPHHILSIDLVQADWRSMCEVDGRCVEYFTEFVCRHTDDSASQHDTSVPVVSTPFLSKHLCQR